MYLDSTTSHHFHYCLSAVSLHPLSHELLPRSSTWSCSFCTCPLQILLNIAAGSILSRGDGGADSVCSCWGGGARAGGVPRPPSSVEVSKLWGSRLPQPLLSSRDPRHHQIQVVPAPRQAVSPHRGSNTRSREAGWKGAHNVSLGAAPPGWVIW